MKIIRIYAVILNIYMGWFHKIVYNSIIENKYWNFDSKKDEENNKIARRKTKLGRADVGFLKYWKPSYMMISKFESLIVCLNVRKFVFHNPLHNTALSFNSLAPRYETVLRQLHAHGFTSIPAWISNYIHYKVWDEINYLFQTSTVEPLKCGKGYVISSHTLIGMWSLIHVGIKVNPCL